MAESTYTAPATYTITFPSLSQSEVKVSINGVLQSSGFTISGYATSGSGTVSFTSAPASGAHVRIFRDTTILSNQAPAPKADFQAGASIQAADLNNNMDQVLYKLAEKVDSGDISADSVVTQAIRDLNVTTAKIANNAVTAAKIDSNILTSHSTQVTDAANSAATATAAATTATNQATAAANQAAAAANSAANAATEAGTIAGTVATAQAAATAAQVQATASAASAATATTNATAAQTTAANAVTIATDADTIADAANVTAVTATNNALTAVTTANASAATANTAIANATTSLNNSRESDGSGGFTSAIDKATTAINTANSASAAVANAVFYTLIANFAAFPSSPSNQDRIEVADSTGLQSQSIIAGLPSGFTGSNDLTVRLEYNSSTSKWDFKQYFAADPESRYIPKSGGTFTGAVSFDDNVIVKGDGTNGSGELTLNCENNSHGIKLKGPPHSANANYTITLPNDTGTNGQSLITNGSGVTSWATTDQTAAEILTAVKTVDGGSSGLDADLLDGQHGSYYTGYTDTAVSNLVDSSPATLNTLNELATALGDDPNFATTTANSIGTKLPLAGGTLTGGLTGTTGTFEAAVNVRTQDAARGLTVNCSSSSQNEALKINANGGAQKILMKHDGSATFAGRMDVTNLASVGDLVFQAKNENADTSRASSLQFSNAGKLILNGNSSNSTRVSIDATNGSATFANRCNFGSSSVADVSGKFSNGDASSATLYVTNHNSSGDLFSGRNSSNTEVINLGVDGSSKYAGNLTVGPYNTQPYLKGAQLFPDASGRSLLVLNADGANATSIGVYNGNTSSYTVTIQANGDANFTGTVSDLLGPLRRVKVDSASTGFSLTAAYAGQLIRQTGSGQTIHFPNGVFSAGDMVSFFNAGTGTLTITAAGTMHNTADAGTGNRTIAAKGMATVICTASNEFAISGSQLT